MFIFDNCNIMQEMWVLIFDCQLSLYSTAQVENFSQSIVKIALYGVVGSERTIKRVWDTSQQANQSGKPYSDNK